MFCSKSDKSCGGSAHPLLWLFLLVIGGFVLASLPELKRYIKISTM